VDPLRVKKVVIQGKCSFASFSVAASVDSIVLLTCRTCIVAVTGRWEWMCHPSAAFGLA
jgi:hypothetical protein